MDMASSMKYTTGNLLVLKNTKTVSDHHQDIVALVEKIFMCLQAARESKEKVLIVTAATDADAAISLEYLQNTMKMEQAVFDQPSEIILTVDD